MNRSPVPRSNLPFVRLVWLLVLVGGIAGVTLPVFETEVGIDSTGKPALSAFPAKVNMGRSSLASVPMLATKAGMADGLGLIVTRFPALGQATVKGLAETEGAVYRRHQFDNGGFSVITRISKTPGSNLSAMAADRVLARVADPAQEVVLGGMLAEVGWKIEAAPGMTKDLRMLRAPIGIDPRAIDQLTTKLRRELPALFVEPDYLLQASSTTVKPNDNHYSFQWALHAMRLPEAWKQTTGSRTVLVGIVDSGVTWLEDLRANSRPQLGFSLYSTDDQNGHGTHVAGIIGAHGNNGMGITGVNWQVQMHSERFLDKNGLGTISGAVTALRSVLAVRPAIITAAWSGMDASVLLKEALQQAADADVLVATAAGNDGLDNDLFPAFPASYNLPNLVVATSHDYWTEKPELANFGARTVHVAAPGESVLGLKHSNATEWVYRSGTSGAAAHVAGVLALMKSAYPLASGAELKTALLNGVRKVPGLAVSSGGVVDAVKALELLKVAAVEMTGLQIDDSLGNHDGVANPGETFDFLATFKNRSPSPVKGLQVGCTLPQSLPLALVDVAQTLEDEIAPGDQVTLRFRAESPPGSAGGEGTLIFRLQHTRMLGEAWDISWPCAVVRTARLEGVAKIAKSLASASGAIIRYTGPARGEVLVGQDGGFSARLPEGSYQLTCALAGYPAVTLETQLPLVEPLEILFKRGELALSTSEMLLTPDSGTSVRSTLKLSNVGDAPLTLAVETRAPKGFSTVGIQAPSLNFAVGETLEVHVVGHSFVTTQGPHTQELAFSPVGSVDLTQTLMVKIEPKRQPAFKADRAGVDFGSFQVGHSRRADLLVTTLDGTRKFDGKARIEGTNAIHLAEPVNIGASDTSRRIVLVCSGSALGTIHGELVIEGGDPRQHVALRIPLWAEVLGGSQVSLTPARQSLMLKQGTDPEVEFRLRNDGRSLINWWINTEGGTASSHVVFKQNTGSVAGLSEQTLAVSVVGVPPVGNHVFKFNVSGYTTQGYMEMAKGELLLQVQPAGLVFLAQQEVGFGQVVVGNAMTKDLVVENRGAAPISCVVPKLPSAFTMGGLPPVLKPASKATARLTFRPTSAGPQSIQTKLADQTVVLSGEGVHRPVLSLRPEQLTFTAPAGELSTQRVTLFNNGLGTAHLQTSVTLNGISHPWLRIDGGGGPMQLAPGHSATIDLVIDARALNKMAGDLALQLEDGFAQQTLRGVLTLAGKPELKLLTTQPAEHYFYAKSGTRASFRLMNDGFAPASLSAIRLPNKAWRYEGEKPKELAPRSALRFDIVAIPTTAQDCSGALRIETSAGVITAQVSAIGQPPPVLEITGHEPPLKMLHRLSSQRSLRLFNPGKLPVAWRFSHTSDSGFVVARLSPSSGFLQPGSQATLEMEVTARFYHPNNQLHLQFDMAGAELPLTKTVAIETTARPAMEIEWVHSRSYRSPVPKPMTSDSIGQVAYGHYLRVANEGSLPLTINSIHTDNPALLIQNLPSLPLTLAPGTAVPDLYLRWGDAAFDAGKHHGNLIIESDDALSSVVTLPAVFVDRTAGRLEQTVVNPLTGQPNGQVKALVRIKNRGVYAVQFRGPPTLKLQRRWVSGKTFQYETFTRKLDDLQGWPSLVEAGTQAEVSMTIQNWAWPEHEIISADLYFETTCVDSHPDPSVHRCNIAVNIKARPVLKLDSTELEFQPVFQGQQSQATLFVKNVGSAPLVLSGLQIDNPSFVCTQSFPVSMQGMSSLGLPLRFQSTTLGQQSATATLTTNDPQAATGSISVKASTFEASAVITPETLHFQLPLGQSASLPIQITNTSAITLPWRLQGFLGSVADGTARPTGLLQSSAWVGNLAPGASVTLQTSIYRTSNAEPQSGYLLLSTGQNPSKVLATVPYIYQRDGGRALSLVPSLDFGPSTVGQWREVTALNTGTEDITVSSISVSGELTLTSGNVSVSGPVTQPMFVYPSPTDPLGSSGSGSATVLGLPLTITKGGARIFRVNVAPGPAGKFEANVSLHHNGTLSQTTSMKVTGERHLVPMLGLTPGRVDVTTDDVTPVIRQLGLANDGSLATSYKAQWLNVTPAPADAIPPEPSWDQLSSKLNPNLSYPFSVSTEHGTVVLDREGAETNEKLGPGGRYALKGGMLAIEASLLQRLAISVQTRNVFDWAVSTGNCNYLGRRYRWARIATSARYPAYDPTYLMLLLPWDSLVTLQQVLDQDAKTSIYTHGILVKNLDSPTRLYVIYGNAPGSTFTDNQSGFQQTFASYHLEKPWLSGAPLAGSLQPGASGEIAISFDPTGLPAGTYEGILSIQRSIGGPIYPPALTAQVPVSMVVQPTPRLKLIAPSETLDFDAVPGAQSKTLELSLRNDGNAPASITELTFSNSQFTSSAQLPLIVPAWSKIAVPVTLTPTASVPDSTLTMKSNAVDGDLVVKLQGWFVTGDLTPSATQLNFVLPEGAGETRTLALQAGQGDGVWRFLPVSTSSQDDPSLDQTLQYLSALNEHGGPIGSLDLLNATFSDTNLTLPASTGTLSFRVGTTTLPPSTSGKVVEHSALGAGGAYFSLQHPRFFCLVAEGPAAQMNVSRSTPASFGSTSGFILDYSGYTSGNQSSTVSTSIAGRKFSGTLSSFSSSSKQGYDLLLTETAHAAENRTSPSYLTSPQELALWQVGARSVSISSASFTGSSIGTSYSSGAVLIVSSGTRHYNNSGSTFNLLDWVDQIWSPLNPSYLGPTSWSTNVSTLVPVTKRVYWFVFAEDKPATGWVRKLTNAEVTKVINYLLPVALSSAPWLTVAPGLGRVPAGESSDIRVTAGAVGLKAGSYAGELQLATLSADPHVVRIPAALTVEARGVLTADLSELNFGNTTVAAPVVKTVRFTNTGSAPLVLSAPVFDSLHYSLHDQLPPTLAPGQTASVTVIHRPQAAGTQNGTLTIQTDSTATPTLVVALHGTGASPPRAELSCGPTLEWVTKHGDSLTRTISLRNPGGEPLHWTLTPPLGETAHVTAQPSDGILGPGQTAEITLSLKLPHQKAFDVLSRLVLQSNALAEGETVSLPPAGYSLLSNFLTPPVKAASGTSASSNNLDFPLYLYSYTSDPAPPSHLKHKLPLAIHLQRQDPLTGLLAKVGYSSKNALPTTPPPGALVVEVPAGIPSLELRLHWSAAPTSTVRVVSEVPWLVTPPTVNAGQTTTSLTLDTTQLAPGDHPARLELTTDQGGESVHLVFRSSPPEFSRLLPDLVDPDVIYAEAGTAKIRGGWLIKYDAKTLRPGKSVQEAFARPSPLGGIDLLLPDRPGIRRLNSVDLTEVYRREPPRDPLAYQEAALFLDSEDNLLLRSDYYGKPTSFQLWSPTNKKLGKPLPPKLYPWAPGKSSRSILVSSGDYSHSKMSLATQLKNGEWSLRPLSTLNDSNIDRPRLSHGGSWFIAGNHAKNLDTGAVWDSLAVNAVGNLSDVVMVGTWSGALADLHTSASTGYPLLAATFNADDTALIYSTSVAGQLLRREAEALTVYHGQKAIPAGQSRPLDLGDFLAGQVSSYKLPIQNPGALALTNITAEVSGPVSGIVSSAPAALLLAKSSDFLNLTIHGKEPGRFEGMLTLRSSSSNTLQRQLPIALRVVSTATPPVPHQAVFWHVHMEGEPVELTANWSGPGPFTQSWMKDRKPIRGALHPQLHLPAARLQDAGSYELQTYSPHGKGAAVFHLAVARPQQQELEVPEGQPLSVGVSIAGKAKEITWVKEDGGQRSSSAVLMLATPTSADSGQYLAIAADDHRQIIVKRLNLIVHTKPEILEVAAQGWKAGLEVSGHVSSKGAQSVEASGLPPGVLLHPITGIFSGAPKAVGNFAVTIKAKGPLSLASTRRISITVAPATQSAGTFAAILLPTSDFGGGRLTLAITAAGAFTGHLELAGSSTVRLAGHFSADSPTQAPTCEIVWQKGDQQGVLHLTRTDADTVEGRLLHHGLHEFESSAVARPQSTVSHQLKLTSTDLLAFTGPGSTVISANGSFQFVARLPEIGAVTSSAKSTTSGLPLFWSSNPKGKSAQSLVGSIKPSAPEGLGTMMWRTAPSSGNSGNVNRIEVVFDQP